MKALVTLLMVIVAVAVGVRSWATRTDVPEAGHAVMQAVIDERRLAALKSQETSQGYVIDPALAGRMLADSGISIRSIAVRGLGPVRIGRAELELPGEGGTRRMTRYFKLSHAPPAGWKVLGTATAREWQVKVW